MDICKKKCTNEQRYKGKKRQNLLIYKGGTNNNMNKGIKVQRYKWQKVQRSYKWQTIQMYKGIIIIILIIKIQEALSEGDLGAPKLA